MPKQLSHEMVKAESGRPQFHNPEFMPPARRRLVVIHSARADRRPPGGSSINERPGRLSVSSF